MLDNIKHWVSYIFKRKSINLIREACVSYPYDWVYLLRLDRVKLEQMLEYFKTNNITGTEPIICRDLRICINLIDIITGKTELVDNDTTGILDPFYLENRKTRQINRRANYKNMNRFIHENYKSFYEDLEDEYYIQKAKHLYFKILNYKLFTFWN